ncbi:MAG: SDR family oxidoreductase [Actinobacteria bacterium]|nr:SDR family oxidoreductase [Actinomycetota bacterium]
MLFDLNGRVALVTGAGQGVGAGIATMLAARGAAVAVNDLRPERAGATVAAITRDGGKAMAFAFDVTDRDAVVAGVGDVAQSLGPVAILVNNAGNGGADAMRPKPFRDTDPAEWEGPVRVNLYGVLHCSHAVVNGMCERRWGRVITIASGAGMVGLDIGVAAYGAGKGGSIGFMRHLAIENARLGVTANTIALGLMEMEQPGDVTARMARTIPVGRLGRPDDAGALCVYLASEEASWMTGQTIQLNGGSVTG